MLSIARSATQLTPASRSFVSFYSSVAGLARTTWRTGGHPAPQSVAAEVSDAADIDYDGESSTPKAPMRRKPSKIPTPGAIKAHRAAMKKEFPEGWAPPRKLSREAMDALRALHATNPETFTTPMLASQFRISPEAVRRVLKSKWEPSPELRARLAEKERKHREEWRKQRKLEELQKQHALVEVMKKKAEKKDAFTFK
ncbi:uncharacterized protein C8Q71DRAFT_197758 [Rhodofomes roseus]|uniref:Required for respiratory growth protein 9, mitochondrial n=1 Tax=Rhodofomes roseus TaxID=34475 RepID=A0ABQ8K7T5_9APHY|nr:uncharacterized protein C8Q71DRAFT_197758 [Rhodofomes roseus]KAH9833321.1 hypothetical protein C8Q71DRAFT_197758 [Rhodofomes roseus]